MRPALFTPRSLAAAILAGLAALAAPGSARAAFVAADSSVKIQSISNPAAYGVGSFTGTIAVDNVDATHSTVQIKLTNTTPGSFITSVAFSLPNTLTSASLTTSAGMSADWRLLGTPTASNSVTGSGALGNFDLGAGIGSSWHTPAGSDPTHGIANGQEGTFEFTLVGAGANVTASALMAYMSQNSASSGSNSSAGIGVRFRTAGDSTVGGKVLASVVPYTPPGGQVPAPPAVLLALAGVGCLLGRGAFRRKAAPATV